LSRRGDRGLKKGQRVEEKKEGYRGDKEPLRGHRAIKGKERRRGCRGPRRHMAFEEIKGCRGTEGRSGDISRRKDKGS
jgi:hypothetical protein